MLELFRLLPTYLILILWHNFVEQINPSGQQFTVKHYWASSCKNRKSSRKCQLLQFHVVSTIRPEAPANLKVITIVIYKIFFRHFRDRKGAAFSLQKSNESLGYIAFVVNEWFVIRFCVTISDPISRYGLSMMVKTNDDS